MFLVKCPWVWNPSHLPFLQQQLPNGCQSCDVQSKEAWAVCRVGTSSPHSPLLFHLRGGNQQSPSRSEIPKSAVFADLLPLVNSPFSNSSSVILPFFNFFKSLVSFRSSSMSSSSTSEPWVHKRPTSYWISQQQCSKWNQQNLGVFLATVGGLWNSSSPIRDWTWAPQQWKRRVLTTGPPEKPQTSTF